MTDKCKTVTMKGNPLALTGKNVAIGDVAPDCQLVGNDLSPVNLSSFRGKIVIISAVPSLDTPVCDMETRRFNQEAAKLGDDVVILTVSMDLPFAQSRWCGAAGIDKVKTLSDHHDASFGLSFGVLLPTLRLLTRAVFVLDAKGIIRFIQIVDEITNEPDYDAVLAAVKALR